jgi:hypothetical protein
MGYDGGMLRSALVLAALAIGLGCGYRYLGPSPQICKDFIACFENTGGGPKGSLDATYGAMGTCWSTGVQQTAQTCTYECDLQLKSLKGRYPDAGC